jgi:hypothetical protein
MRNKYQNQNEKKKKKKKEREKKKGDAHDINKTNCLKYKLHKRASLRRCQASLFVVGIKGLL